MKRFINARPFLIIAVATLCGVGITASCYLTGVAILLFIPISAFLISLLAIVLTKRTTLLYLLCVTAVAFILSSLLTASDIRNFYSCERFDGLDNATVCGKVANVTDNDYGYRVYLTDVTVDGSKLNGKFCFDVGERELQRGDLVMLKCNTRITELNTYLKNDKLALIATNVQGYEKVGSEYSFFDKINQKIKVLTARHFNGNFPIVFGLLTGDTSYMNELQMQNYRFSGIAHIFAVSGLHIGFMTVLLKVLCDALSIKRLWRTLIIGIVTFCYSGICGFSVSSVRAVIMSTTYLFAVSRGEKYDLINSWSLALILVLLANRLDMFTIGFALSFACVFSIALFYKTFETMLPIKSEKLKQSLSTGLSVQLGVTPLACYYFGYTSAISLLLNLVFVPIISIIYGALTIFLTISMIIPQLSFLLVWTNYIVNFVVDILNCISFVRFTRFIELNAVAVICYYLIAIFVSDRLNVSKWVKITAYILSLAFLAVFAL